MASSTPENENAELVSTKIFRGTRTKLQTLSDRTGITIIGLISIGAELATMKSNKDAVVARGRAFPTPQRRSQQRKTNISKQLGDK